MKKVKVILIAGTIVALSLLVLTAQAGKGWNTERKCEDPIPQEKQTKLLEKFGEKGIDADQNGTLTCEETKAFFGKRHHGDNRGHRDAQSTDTRHTIHLRGIHCDSDELHAT